MSRNLAMKGACRLIVAGVVAAIAGAGSQARAQGVIPPAPQADQGPPVQIAVDLSRTEGPLEPKYNWFGYDEANYTTTPLGMELLGELRDLGPAPLHIRV